MSNVPIQKRMEVMVIQMPYTSLLRYPMVMGTISKEVDRLMIFKTAEYRMLVVNILFLVLLVVNFPNPIFSEPILFIIDVVL